MMMHVNVADFHSLLFWLMKTRQQLVSSSAFIGSALWKKVCKHLF